MRYWFAIPLALALAGTVQAAPFEPGGPARGSGQNLSPEQFAKVKARVQAELTKASQCVAAAQDLPALRECRPMRPHGPGRGPGPGGRPPGTGPNPEGTQR